MMACTFAAVDGRTRIPSEGEAVTLRAESPTSARRREVIERWESLRSLSDAEVLGVAGETDPGSVKAAYVRLARRFHPDAASADTADLRDKLQEIFIRMTEAYRALSTHRRVPETRLHNPAPRPTPPAAPARTPANPAGHAVSPPRPAVQPLVPLRVRVDEAFGRAQALLETKQPAAAAALLEHYTHEVDGEQAERLHMLLGRSYLEMHAWRRSAAHLREAMAFKPENPDAHLLLGEAYEGAGFATRAETAYRKVLLLRPGHVQALMRLSGIRPSTPPRRPPSGIVARLFGSRHIGG
jgi:tetratricopeptide (TPR) repeat protein